MSHPPSHLLALQALVLGAVGLPASGSAGYGYDVGLACPTEEDLRRTPVRLSRQAAARPDAARPDASAQVLA